MEPEFAARRQKDESAMPGTFSLGRLADIEIGVHYTWLIAFALVAYSLAVGFFPSLFPGLDTGTYWAIGAVATLLLFVSVLVHELSHSLVAKARGLPVHSITLFIFGGVSNIREEPRTPGTEFVVAAVGPASSLILGGIFWGLYLAAETATAPVRAVLFYLAIVNVILAVFNLLPGFPLDGGRVLRAILWGITGNLRKATNWASGVGQFFAFLLIVFGVFQVFAGNVLGGIWMAFIGWFLNGAAESSRRQLVMNETFRGIRVRDLMTPDPPIVAPTLPVSTLIEEYAVRRGARAVLVAEDGRLVGIATLTDVHKLSPDRWGTTRVADIMTPVPLVTVGPTMDVPTALRLMGERDLNQLPVLRSGRVVGLLTRGNVIHYFRLEEELGAPPPTIGGVDEEGEEPRRAA